MMGHDGVTRLTETEAFSSIGGSCQSFNILSSDDCRGLIEGFKNVFSGVQFAPCDESMMKYLNGNDKYARSSNDTCIKFPDGSEIFEYMFWHSASGVEHPSGGNLAELDIDVNGPKNPNTYGRDIFSLIIANNGVVYGKGSQPFAEMASSSNPAMFYWKTAYEDDFKCEPRGYACAARVLEEDAMNY